MLLPASIGIAATAVIIASVEPANDPLTWLTNVGVAGIWLILFVAGRIRSEKEVKRLETELDKKDLIIQQKDEQLVKLQDSIIQQAIPALTRSTQALEHIVVENRKAT